MFPDDKKRAKIEFDILKATSFHLESGMKYICPQNFLSMKWLITPFFILLTLVTTAQTAKIPPVDKSPLVMIYFPVDYPVLKIKEKTTEPLSVRVVYRRPARNNRTIFGDLVEYNTVWRLGANEATEIEFYKDVKIGGKKVPK